MIFFFYRPTKESTNLQIPPLIWVSMFTDHVHRDRLEISCLSRSFVCLIFDIHCPLVDLWSSQSNQCQKSFEF
jgi:hypothetical protein